MIALIGSEGSMGLRYQAILNHLKEEFIPLDRLNKPEEMIVEYAATCDRIIIATPTHTHTRYLRELLPTKKPILCEKPVCKNLDELKELHLFAKKIGATYQMVMQYRQLAEIVGPFITDHGESLYNYFRHGNDGLAWDCLQIIGLSNGPVTLKESSPLWECKINGWIMNHAYMDACYIYEIQSWLKGEPSYTLDQIELIHEKVQAWKDENEQL